MADLAVLQARGHYPKLTDAQEQGLRAALGSRVALANPLDYHTYIWGEEAAMADTFTAMLDGPVDIGVVVVDFPRNDRCSTQAGCVIEAAALADNAAASRWRYWQHWLKICLKIWQTGLHSRA